MIRPEISGVVWRQLLVRSVEKCYRVHSGLKAEILSEDHLIGIMQRQLDLTKSRIGGNDVLLYDKKHFLKIKSIKNISLQNLVPS